MHLTNILKKVIIIIKSDLPPQKSEFGFVGIFWMIG